MTGPLAADDDVIGRRVFDLVVSVLKGQVLPQRRHEYAPRAADAETQALIEEVRTMHEDGGLSYRQLARRYGVPRPTIIGWCTYRRR